MRDRGTLCHNSSIRRDLGFAERAVSPSACCWNTFTGLSAGISLPVWAGLPERAVSHRSGTFQPDQYCRGSTTSNMICHEHLRLLALFFCLFEEYHRLFWSAYAADLETEFSNSLQDFPARFQMNHPTVAAALLRAAFNSFFYIFFKPCGCVQKTLIAESFMTTSLSVSQSLSTVHHGESSSEGLAHATGNYTLILNDDSKRT
jgi:hypothetical protein